jgi:hypothetical protein
MDVVINSQIQSPLVRTLARTKGKSQSFTHNIADNVAPCSFTKIQLSSQNQGETQFGRNYKLKIPQYGYLRDIILKYTTEERPIDAKVVEIAQPLYTHYYTALEDVRAAGSFLGIGSNPNASQTVNSTTWARSADITWYNAQNIVRMTSGNGYDSTVIEAGALADVASVLVPQFGSLFTDTLSSAFVGNNGVTTGSGTRTLATSARAPVSMTVESYPFTEVILTMFCALYHVISALLAHVVELTVCEALGLEPIPRNEPAARTSSRAV